jgi:hypothetical protein
VTVTELVGWEHSLKNELIIARYTGASRHNAAVRLEADPARTQSSDELAGPFHRLTRRCTTCTRIEPASRQTRNREWKSGSHAARPRLSQPAVRRMFWTFGIFLAVPWHESRMLALNSGRAASARHPADRRDCSSPGARCTFSRMADRTANPALYRSLCIALVIGSLLAVYGGMSWSSARLA